MRRRVLRLLDAWRESDRACTVIGWVAMGLALLTYTEVVVLVTRWLS